jgi:excinuclease ABC subunit C
LRRLWTEEPVADFGADPFRPFAPPPASRAAGVTRKKLRAAVRAECRNEPGVYGMLDEDGSLIYVGKSKRLRARILSYFTPGNRNEKSGHIIAQTRTLLWEPAPCEFSALLRELHLIQTRRPRFNVKDQPRRSRPPSYVCVGRPDAPGVFVTNRPAEHVLKTYGPLWAGRRAMAAVEALNRHCRLRDCANTVRMRFADQRALFGDPERPGCLRLDLGTCHGPCVGACTRTAYTRSVREAMHFLDGSDVGLLDALAERMRQAAAACRFELAARLRDELDSLTGLRETLDLLQEAREKFTFVYPVGEGEAALWYLIRCGRIVGVARPPVDAESAAETYRRLNMHFGRKLPENDLSTHPPDTMLLVSSWFHRQPEHLAETISVATAKRRCLLRTRPR